MPGEVLIGEGRTKSKLDAGGNSGVGGGRERGLPETFGLSGLIPLPCEPPEIRRTGSNAEDEAVPGEC